MDEAADGPLFRPTEPERSRTARFLNRVNENRGHRLASYEDLYRWSTDEIGAFWSDVWDETDIVGHKGAHVVDAGAALPTNPAWFVQAEVNWAENMLRFRDDRVALVEAVEPTLAKSKLPLRRVTYAQLYALTADVASALLSYGLKPGDRVASYSSNCLENVAACLAATAIGCIWVSAAADFGPDGVFERFEQVKPTIIFAVDAVAYNAKVHPHLPKVKTLLAKLSANAINPKVVIIESPWTADTHRPEGWDDHWDTWTNFAKLGAEKDLGRADDGEIKWARLGFNWPLWILFSSGTTGRPKPIVHRSGGMLIQSKKELVICAGLERDDVFFYYTTTGWMMWNFLVGGLSVGCTLVLYDGSPLRDPAYLWNLVDELGITIYGTSAKYLDQLAKVYKPLEHHNLSTLRQIHSTGSPLAPIQYDYAYEHISPDIIVASITGGTDICSLFAGINTSLPVFRGEIQCRMLGMAIDVFAQNGTPSGPDEAGELVCTKPFPCMPIGFWPLPGFGAGPDEERGAAERYHKAYFAEFDGVWYHGDHCMLTRSRDGNGGGLVMLGRSDGVLNPGGVRFGSAEIYDVLELCFSAHRAGLPAADAVVQDCLAVGQAIDGGADERVILFVQLAEGAALTPALEARIRAEIRQRRSARHVPARILRAEVPYTLNGKRVEVPVKKLVNGAPLSSINPATLRNPECLAVYVEMGQRLREEVMK